MRYFPGSNREALVDLDEVPSTSPYMGHSQTNLEWNEHMLLTMQRAGMVRILDTRIPVEHSFLPNKQEEDLRAWLPIELCAPDATNSKITFFNRFGDVREDEKRSIWAKLDELRLLITMYAGNKTHECLADHLADLYPDTVLACGGCPDCRSHGRQPYSHSLTFAVDGEAFPSASSEIHVHAEIEKRIRGGTALTLTWEGPRHISSLTRMREQLSLLIHEGHIQQIVMPDALLDDEAWATALVHDLSRGVEIAHTLLPSRWLGARPHGTLYPVSTLVVYPPDDAHADTLYMDFMHCSRQLPTGTPVVYLVNRAVYLTSAGGLFVNRVDGVKMAFARLTALLQPAVLEF
jgi:hypothetical protein